MTRITRANLSLKFEGILTPTGVNFAAILHDRDHLVYAVISDTKTNRRDTENVRRGGAQGTTCGQPDHITDRPTR
jgi:hypothetical protein